MSVSYGGDSITFADGSVQSGASTSFKNRVHNGNFDVWQRGTSMAASTATFSADRWFHNMWPTANGTVSQVATAQTGLPPNCIKMQRTATSTANGSPFVGQALETVNSKDLAGQQVTFSFYAKCGANFSASSSNMLVAFWTGTGTDQTCQSGTGNNWTNQVAQLSYVAQAITTTWTRYSWTITIPTNATQIGFQIGYTPTGTAGADDSIYFTGVQLEKGASASSVEYRPYSVELQLCQRYLPAYRHNGQDILPSQIQFNASTTSRGFISFPVPTRVPVTGMTISSASHFTIFGFAGGNGTASAFTMHAGGTMAAGIDVGTGTSFTTRDCGTLGITNSSGFVYFTGAEL